MTSLKKCLDQTRRRIIDWIWQSTLFLVIFTIAFLWISADWCWTWGWLFLILFWLFMAAQPILLLPIHPELLAERSRGILAEGTKKWDQVIVIFASLFWFITWIVPVLDHRFHWTFELHIWLHGLGAIGTFFGFSLFIWAMVENAYFAEGVRIQKERGHSVCTTGPYRLVRHPGYAGNIIAIFSTALLLGSLWSLIPALLSANCFILRTYLEDETLKKELMGYLEYTNQTPYRLFPIIW